MSERPIACSLTDAELAGVIERYGREASLFQATARIEGGTARVTLRGEKALLSTFLREMIERERRCCPFLRLGVTESHDGYILEMNGEGLGPAEIQVLVRTIFPAAELAP